MLQTCAGVLCLPLAIHGTSPSTSLGIWCSVVVARNGFTGDAIPNEVFLDPSYQRSCTYIIIIKSLLKFDQDTYTQYYFGNNTTDFCDMCLGAHIPRGKHISL